MIRRRPGGRGVRPPPVVQKQPVFDKGWDKIICVASGPSLTAEQGFRISCASGWKVIAVNNSWERVPMADVLYACDQRWWTLYHEQVAKRFQGECWTGDRWAAHKYGLCHVQLYDNPGLSLQQGIIHSGGNGGYQAVNLAYQFGAKRIILVGYDFQRTYGMDHWHGAHVKELGELPGSDSSDDIHDWVRRFRALAHDLQDLNVRLINCSIESALDMVPRDSLDNELEVPDAYERTAAPAPA